MLFCTGGEYKCMNVVCFGNPPLYYCYVVRQKGDRSTMHLVAMRLFCFLVSFPWTTLSLNKAGTIQIVTNKCIKKIF